MYTGITNKHSKDVRYTARSRKSLSLPMDVLKGKVILAETCLDYGCGRGYDCDTLGIDGYDKFWRPKRPTKKYDVIFCIYVLNVVNPNEQEEIIQDIKSLLKDGGICYFAVRRDVNNMFKTIYGGQRFVILPYESFYHKKGAFEIYKVRKEQIK